jgi:hypothetical protein
LSYRVIHRLRQATVHQALFFNIVEEKSLVKKEENIVSSFLHIVRFQHIFFLNGFTLKPFGV